jgi:hypothetical protein
MTIGTMNIELVYTTTPLAASGSFVGPLDSTGAATWMQISLAPLITTVTVKPVAHERRWIRGWVDTDQASAANGLEFRFSDDASTVRATVYMTIPANSAGEATTFAVRIPGGKYVQVSYTNGAVAQTRFVLLALLTEV